MKIQLLSDLHVEFTRYEKVHPINNDVDVVVLAGDIGVDPEKTFNWIFDNMRHKPVVFVTGNHEYYYGEIAKIDCAWKQYDEENEWFHFLQNGNATCINDQIFIGGTLWTDFNNNNLMTKIQCQQVMTDFHVIKQADGYPIGPETVQDIHYATVVRIDKNLAEHPDAIVVTHHLPHQNCVNVKYKDDYHTNGAYATDLQWLFDKHPNIPLWVNGHTHLDYDIKIGNTRIVCNPYGYEHHEVNPGFNPNLILEVLNVTHY